MEENPNINKSETLDPISRRGSINDDEVEAVIVPNLKSSQSTANLNAVPSSSDLDVRLKHAAYFDLVKKDLMEFVFKPAPQNVLIKCQITRDKRGIEGRIYPTYCLRLEIEDGKHVFLMVAKKRKKNTTSNYLISIDPTDLNRSGSNFMGKLRFNFFRVFSYKNKKVIVIKKKRSNLLGTQFTVNLFFTF